MEIRRRERRPPATLRTRTGCTNCRARRKKCDERHPSCAACSKKNLKCSWPLASKQVGLRHASQADYTGHSSITKAHRPASVSMHPAQRDLNPPLLGYTSLLRSYPPPTALGPDQALLNHYASNLCSILLRNNAHPEFQRYFLMSSILPRLQLMVDPLLACASLDLSKNSPRYRCLAVKYYSQAVTIIRHKISSGIVRGTEDWLLLNILHLNLFETWDATGSTPVLLHIQGAAQILKLRGTAWPESSSALRSTSDKVFARIAAEAFVYHAVSWSIFNGNPISMPVNELWDFLEPYFSIRPFPTASDAENSPVLGVPWQLYRFLSDLTQLTHRLPLNPSDYDTALELAEKLDAWESEELADFEEGAIELSAPTPTTQYKRRTRLFVLALRVLLFKFLNPEACVSGAAIQNYVLEAIQLIRLRVTERFHFWPLLIIGSAVLRQDQADIIRFTLEDMSRSTNSGTFLKITRVLETIWDTTITEHQSRQAKIRAQLDDSGAEDGLDLLLGRTGVPGLINA